MISSTGFWNIDKDSSDFSNEHRCDPGINKFLVQIIPKNTLVYDFGCGPGEYVNYLNNNGIYCKGFDGNPTTFKITNCFVLDLTSKFQFDKVPYLICLEVGEHVPNEYEDILLTNITNHLQDGGKLILSWAIEGQSGLGHVNCKNNDYIINKLQTMGYIYDKIESNLLRASATISYFKNTLMVFQYI